jgi:hypothetical protein
MTESQRVAILLGNSPEIQAGAGGNRESLFEIVEQLLADEEEVWRQRLGVLMYENTVADIR